jgi:hypothetical protein
MPTTNIQDRSHAAGTFSLTGDKNDDTIGFDVPPGEVVVAVTLQILHSSSNGGARITTQPQTGTTGHVEVKVHWWYDLRGDISYRVILSTAVAGTAALDVRVPGFTPAMRGFHFGNSFPSPTPLLRFTLPNGTPVATLGDAANGLCGGMVYAVRDLFESNTPVPPDTTPPVSGPLFDYIVTRLFDSFSLPTGPTRYYELMDPLLPDHETVASQHGLAPHGRAYRMIHDEWPLIRADLDAGRTSCLGLVRVKSADPTQLGNNHQVLAFGYTITGTRITLHLYDPNYHDRDVTLSFESGDPDHSITLAYSEGDTFFSFFRTAYTFKMPALGATTSKPGLVILFEDANFSGRSRLVDSVEPDLSAASAGGLNDKVSSLIIARGTWRFFRDARFAQPYLKPDGTPLQLGPGLYSFVGDHGISNDDLSSMICVA